MKHRGLLEIVSRLLDQTCEITFPVVIRSRAYSGVSSYGIGRQCWHYKWIKIPRGWVGIDRRQLKHYEIRKEESSGRGIGQLKGGPV